MKSPSLFSQLDNYFATLGLNPHQAIAFQCPNKGERLRSPCESSMLFEALTHCAEVCHDIETDISALHQVRGILLCPVDTPVGLCMS